MARPGPILNALRALSVGNALIFPGVATKYGNFTRSARRGTPKRFECVTLTTGVRIKRVE